MESLCYEDFEPGIEFDLGERVISGEDVRAFAAVTGDFNPLHLDEDYAAGTVFGRPIAHGLLGVSVAAGLLNQARLTAGTLVALTGLEWRFLQPVYPGEAVQVKARVEDRRATRENSRGLVRLRIEVCVERGVAQDGLVSVLVKRRSPPEATPS